VDADGDDEDGEEAEEDDGVDEDGDGAGGHVAELDDPRPRGELEQQARREHHEEDHRHDDGAPVRARPWRRHAASARGVHASSVRVGVVHARVVHDGRSCSCTKLARTIDVQGHQYVVRLLSIVCSVMYKVGKWLGKEGRNACPACARSKQEVLLCDRRPACAKEGCRQHIGGFCFTV